MAILAPAQRPAARLRISAGELRAFRRAAHWTQAEVAIRLGITRAVVCTWERGQRAIPAVRAAQLVEVFASAQCEREALVAKAERLRAG